MTGVSGPAQMLLETTSTRRSSPGRSRRRARPGVGGRQPAAMPPRPATRGRRGDRASASSAVTAAVIGSASVPNGNVARRFPAASTRNTSAVWAIP